MSISIVEFFNQVYDQTYLRVLSYVSARLRSKEDVQDVVQEVYAEFYRRLRRSGVDYFHEPEGFLINTAKQRLSKLYRAKKPILLSADDDNLPDRLERLPDPDCQIEEEYITTELLQSIWQELSSGDAQTFEIFKLCYLQEKTLEEIATETGLPLHTVKNKLYRTLNRLRARLNKGRYQL